LSVLVAYRRWAAYVILVVKALAVMNVFNTQTLSRISENIFFTEQVHNDDRAIKVTI